jgi:transcription elongation GreA/GreB family factor
MAALQRETSAEVTRLQKLARLQKFEELEKPFYTAIENSSFSISDSVAVLDVIEEQQDPQRTENMVKFLIETTTQRRGPAEGLEAARQAAGLAPDSGTIRNITIGLYQKVFSSETELDALLTMTLMRENIPLHAGVQQLDKFLALRAVTYAFDKSLSAPAKIIGINKEERTLTAIANGEEKQYDPAVINRLEPLEADDYRALAVFEVPRLEELANDNAGELIRLVLKAYGPTLKFKEAKEYLMPVIKSIGWSKWWTQAKQQIKRSPIVEMSDAAQPSFTLRARPVAYEFRVRDQFDNADSLENKILTVLEYLREKSADSHVDENLLKFFDATLQKLGAASRNPMLQMASLATVDQVAKKFPQIVHPVEFDFDKMISSPGELATAMNDMYDDEVAKLVLNFIRSAKPDQWYDLFAVILPGASAGVAEWIAGQLLEQGVKDSFNNSIKMISQWPERHVRAIIWMWKAVCTGKCPEPLAKIDHATILTGLLTAAQGLKRKPTISDLEQQKRILNQIRNALASNKYELIRKVMKAANRDYANYIKDTYARNMGLSDAVKSDISIVLREVRPELFTKVVSPWDEDVVYTTEAALNRKNDELAKLVNVDIAHNAKTIGEAAERGDLRENSEFTAALEERDRLTERATRLQNELKRAKIIHQGMANGDSITIGSKVKTKNVTTNQMEDFFFLGPWEADPDHGVYSYLAPLARSFMGKKQGEVVVHKSDAGESQWEVLEITPGV